MSSSQPNIFALGGLPDPCWGSGGRCSEAFWTGGFRGKGGLTSGVVVVIFEEDSTSNIGRVRGRQMGEQNLDNRFDTINIPPIKKIKGGRVNYPKLVITSSNHGNI